MLEYNGERAKKKREQRAERRIKSTNKCKRGITAFVYLKISHMHSNYPWYFKSVRPKRPGIQIGCNFRPFPLWMRQKSIVNIQKKRADDGNTLNNAIHCNLSHIRTIPAQKRSNKTTMVDEKKKCYVYAPIAIIALAHGDIFNSMEFFFFHRRRFLHEWDAHSKGYWLFFWLGS